MKVEWRSSFADMVEGLCYPGAIYGNAVFFVRTQKGEQIQRHILHQEYSQPRSASNIYAISFLSINLSKSLLTFKL